MPPMLTREDIAFMYLEQLPFEPYPFQEEAILDWFSSEQGTLVCAPTGMGKTLIAEAGIYEAMKTGKLQWAWCFVSEFFTFFKIESSRGSKVLHETLGDDFLGSISSDFFSAYLKYKKETETFFQFCWAHLIREIKFLATLNGTQAYGKRLLKYVKEMFATIHRQDKLTERGFKRLMNRHKKSNVLRLLSRRQTMRSLQIARMMKFHQLC